MKKIILVLSIFFVLLFLGIISLSFVFKSKIKEIVLQEIDKQINADFNFSEISISPFKNFPHVCITFHDLSLVGKEYFRKDTLLSVNKLSTSFDIWSVLNGNEIEMNSIHISNPIIHAIVAKNGLENYNILHSTNPSKSIHTKSSNFKINIDEWSINNGKIIYDNKIQHTYINLAGINHTGNGDFDQDVSDLNIFTEVSELTFVYQGVKYFNKKLFKTDLIMEMNLKENKFTFKDHLFEINHFKFGFDGFFKLLKDGYQIDIKFAVKETAFKNLLSILPGILMKDTKNIQTKGDFACNGFIKGVYKNNQKEIPTFGINFNVDNAMFKYKHLPTAITGINLKLRAENVDGNPENTKLNIRNFNLNLGKNPVYGNILIKGIENFDIIGTINAKINLEDLAKMYPLDGTQLKGNLATNLKIEGTYNKSKKQFPTLDASIIVKNGFLKSNDYPIPMEEINCSIELKNDSGKYEDTNIQLNKFSFLLDSEPFELTGAISNLADYNYQLKAKGIINLEKITKIYPIEKTHLSGIVKVDINTKGCLSDVKNKVIENLHTSGTIEVKNVNYQNSTITNPIQINNALFDFSPHKIAIQEFNCKAGKSTIELSGHFYEYIPYLLMKTENLKADLQLKCDTLDFNEWSTKSQKTDSITTATNLIEIPKGLDVVFDSDVKFIKFGAIGIYNLQGEIILKEGVLKLQETGFDAVNAKFTLNGDYDTRNLKHPLFDIKINVNKLDILNAYNSFNSIQMVTPSAGKTDGLFSANYKISGELRHDYQPILETVKGEGRISIENAKIKGMKLFNHISKITKKKEFNDPQIKDIVMDTEIKNGKIHIKPFSFKISRFLVDIEGVTGFDNTINYLVKIAVLNKIKIPLHVSGTVENPLIKLGKGHEKYNFDEM